MSASASLDPRPSPYEFDLDRNPANYSPLTPIGFLERSASIYPDRTSMVHGSRRYTWRRPMPAAAASHRASPRAGSAAATPSRSWRPTFPPPTRRRSRCRCWGAVVNTINTRLDADTVGFILGHGEAKAIVADRELSPTVGAALAKLDRPPLIIDVDDPDAAGGERLGEIEYEAFLADGDPELAWQGPPDEWDALALNYTSGTTGNPKGVVYSHRGAYLNALTNAVAWNMAHHPVVPLDPADVPLQRLVLSVDPRRRRGHRGCACGGWDAKSIYDAIAREGGQPFLRGRRSSSTSS